MLSPYGKLKADRSLITSDGNEAMHMASIKPLSEQTLMNNYVFPWS